MPLFLCCHGNMFLVGLKTVIGQLPQMNQTTSNAACRNITDQLVGSIGNPVSGRG